MTTQGQASAPPACQLPVYLLGGGRSRRFGAADKLRVEIGGEPLLAHVARALSGRASRLTVVADVADKYADLGLRTIADSGRHLGPLDGLRAALEDLAAHDDGPWLALVGGDMAHLRPQWLDLLATAGGGGADSGVVVGPPACAFRFEGRYEPLFALYALTARATVARRLDEGALSMRALLDALGAAALEAPPGWHEVVNINWPAELATVDG